MGRRLASFLLYGGIAAVVVGLSKVHATAHGYDYSQSARLGWSVLFIGVLWVSAYAVGLPHLDSRRSAFLNSALANLLGLTAISAVQLVVVDALLPRVVVFGSVVVLVPYDTLIARLSVGFRGHDAERDRVLVIGNLDEIDQIQADCDRALRPLVLVEPMTVAEAMPVTGNDEAFVDHAIASGATVVALSRAAQSDEGILGQAATLHEAGVRIRSLSALYEEWLGKLPLNELERVSLMFDIAELHESRYGRAKRIIDIGLAIIGVAVFVAVIPCVVLGDLCANRGSLFFRQTRVGRNGKPFTILKFRTMRSASSGDGQWTAADDHRVTRFGRLLRRTHLDELPQMINVLRGDLSLVGPRPEQPRYVEELRKKIPFYDLRHLVRPGLTGWAQVNYDYGATDEDALEKLQYEFWYLRHQSIGMDARVLARTVQHVLRHGGR